jgi:hypothetical protein
VGWEIDGGASVRALQAGAGWLSAGLS